jgi:hypothetical protein
VVSDILDELDDREYKHSFHHVLTALFAGFPSDLLASLRARVDVERLMRLLRSEGDTAHESAVYAAISLIEVLVAPLSEPERRAALEALERRDKNNALYKSFHYMLRAVGELDVRPALRSRISYEIVRQLLGMSE